MKEYILIKLRSGEEIVASIMSKNRSGLKVFRPMQIKQIPFVDPVSGTLKAAVIMENWIGRTNENEVTIPNNWVGIKMLPSKDVVDVYEKQMEKEDAPSAIEPKEDDPSAPEPKEDPLMSRLKTGLKTDDQGSILKEVEDEMNRLLLEMTKDAGNSGMAFFPPMVDSMENFGKMGKDDREMVIVNFMFPPKLFKQMMEEGLIDDFLTAGMSMGENGDDSFEDREDDVYAPKRENAIRENDVDIVERGDETYGNSYRDWSSNPNDYM
jgi:hypothetical protein